MKLKESDITEQDSLHLTRNLLRIAIPENYFNDKNVPALEMKIKKLMPLDAESQRLIDWMEKGVYDALQKKYLKTLLFCVCETVEGPMIEEYAFSFSYSTTDSQEVSMNVSRTGNKMEGTFNSTTELTTNQMRSSACKMVRTLVQLMRTLDKMPEERTILMKLLYHDDVTILQPADYEPPFFKGCTEQEAHHPWMKNPLRMEVGNVNSKHFVLALKVKSVLDPCEDEINNSPDDVSLGADSTQKGDYSDSDSDSEVSQSQEDGYMVAPVDKQRAGEDDRMIDEDDTQDPMEDEQQLVRVKDWVSCFHLDTIELTDILSNFPDISEVLIEGIVANLVKEGLLSQCGADKYTIWKQKTFDYEFDAVKEEMDCQAAPVAKIAQKCSAEDILYTKALYHALPLNYISVAKLQSNHEGEVNQNTARKLLDKMVSDGYIEPKSNRRLGKRVIHSDATEKKLIEVKKVLQIDSMQVEFDESLKPDLNAFQNLGINQRDMSTCGNLHSIGSDLTRTKCRSATHQNGSTKSDHFVTNGRDHLNTPTSRAEIMIESVQEPMRILEILRSLWGKKSPGELISGSGVILTAKGVYQGDAASEIASQSVELQKAADKRSDEVSQQLTELDSCRNFFLYRADYYVGRGWWDSLMRTPYDEKYKDKIDAAKKEWAAAENRAQNQAKERRDAEKLRREKERDGRVKLQLEVSRYKRIKLAGLKD